MNWTDERVEKLKRLWAEGLSASQIAAQLGGVSRNAVIGKVHRLNLPGRAKAGGVAAASRAPAKRPAVAPRPATFASRVTPARPIARTVGATALQEEIDVDTVREIAVTSKGNVVVPISKQLALTDLTERTCKWPVGDPLKDDFHFCGCESPDASPYCAYHARLAYQPVHERRRTAARA
ncbi:GcrA cell cycle regulator [Neorhizobium lilium]|uniref:GcrA cell cycle regulator n=1 Tax=Neorhizobium lilium TaxID=2503024 RepID=A0A444LFU7_9HYPH|nr:GcrA family cell cycle regulator [Neorhizobium lilium]RWX76900.1 GcrA cell cycle regulator [Neorhizobium lilium]